MHKEKIIDCLGRGYSCIRPFIWVLWVPMLPNSAFSSGIDAQFKLQRQTSHRMLKDESEVLSLYRGFFARSMYSHCKWFPSDSQYLSIMSKRCGRPLGTVFAFSRFMTENESHRLSVEAINDKGHIRFVDFKDDCEIF